MPTDITIVTRAGKGSALNATEFDANVSNLKEAVLSQDVAGALIGEATAKSTPADADMVGLMDSAASNTRKKLSWANIKAALLSGVTLAAQAVGFTISGGTTSKTLTVSETLTLPAIAAAGAIPYGSAANVLTALAAGAANLKLFMNAAGTAPEWSAGFKIGTFTYDLSTASGPQVITGVGFLPNFVEFAAGVNATGLPLSLGWDDGTTHEGFNQESGLTTDNNFAINTSMAIRIITNASFDRQSAVISAKGSDGFTLTWTKVGSPAGTATILYKAYR